MRDHILVVDDDADAREVLVRVVHFLGLEAATAADGDEALALIRVNLPRLVMLDLMMPKRDGFSVLAIMRAQPLTRQIPVIVVTACSSDQLETLKLPGVAGVVQKGGFSLDGLTALIRSQLQGCGQSRMAVTTARMPTRPQNLAR